MAKKKEQLTPAFSADVEANLEDYEYQCWEVLALQKQRGAFTRARTNILAAIRAGWFDGEWGEAELSAMPKRERIVLSDRIDQHYLSFLPERES